MSNRFSCLVAGLSVSLILSSGCTPWGNLPFNRTATRQETNEPQTDTSPPFQDTQNKVKADDDKFGDRDRPLDGRDFGNNQRNEASQNDFLLGRRAEDVGELESARKFYQNVLRKHPTHAHAHHRLGVVADKKQHFAEAERHYKSALKYMSPDNRQEISIVFSDLGYSYLLRGDFPQSERALNNALAYNENSRIATRNLALLHGYRGDFEKAYQNFASVGGEAEARAELDRLFPHWQNNPDTIQNSQTSPPSLAANGMPAQPATNSSTFPTSRVVESRQFPQPSLRTAPPSTSLKTSQHLTFNSEPIVDPRAQTAPPERRTAKATATRQPLQAPAPHEYLVGNTPGQYSAPPSQPPTMQHSAPPTSQIMQAGYTAIEQPPQRQQPAVTTQVQNPGRPTPHIAIQIDNIQTEPTIPASRTALVLGGAIGMGGMFPASQIKQPQTIQQMSAEVPNSRQFPHVTHPQIPTTTTPAYSPPANVPPKLIRSPNPSLDRTDLIPSSNATNYRQVPVGGHSQQVNSPKGTVPNSYAAPQIPHAHTSPNRRNPLQ